MPGIRQYAERYTSIQPDNIHTSDCLRPRCCLSRNVSDKYSRLFHIHMVQSFCQAERLGWTYMNLNTNSHTLPTASDLSTEKRSICLMNDSFPPVIDGVANAVTNYASVIQRSYGNATVVTPYYPDADDSIYPFPVLRYPSIDTTKLVGYRAGLPLSPELMAQVEGRHIDLIHSHCPVTSTILARMLRQRLHVPLVFTYHTKFDIDIANAIHSKRLQEASIKLLVENISACDEVWTVSRGAGENLRSLGYQGDYIVMPNGVDIPSDRLPEETVRAVSEGLDLPEGVPLLLFVGRMMWYKGLRIILDALKQLKGEGQDFRMVFIGKGTDGEAIRAYAEELCLGDKIFFLPPCYDREIIRAWYCRADLFLFPSTFDTNGLVVREAAACGLASVLIAGSCAAEDVTDGRNFSSKKTPLPWRRCCAACYPSESCCGR